jgi:hypothetical protein
MSWRAIAFSVAAVAAIACSVDTIPNGLRATPPGTGPQVVFDLLKRPLPEIPFPNDIATFADPTSRTGRRINASLVAPTHSEHIARMGFDELEGWGTFAPVAVSFTRGEGTDLATPAIDLDDLHARMGGSTWDTTDDAVYIVNLTTGVPVLLDLGSGAFPLSVVSQDQYYPNDPRRDQQNILLDTANERPPGFTQADYAPSLDTDFDGYLDEPNTYGPGKIPGADNLMTWYERQTDTLLLRPMVPMDEMTEYAVVLTDRLRGSNGKPVRSPFPYVHHPVQRASVAKLSSILSDGARKNYYGDIAGTGLDHVAFAWTFTTQPVVQDLLALRDGLYGKGPFARFADEFPAKLTLHRAAGTQLDLADEPSGWQSRPECATVAKAPYAAPWASAKVSIGAFFDMLFSLSPSAKKLLLDTLDNVEYFVVGTFEVPNLQGDPQSPDPDQHFDINSTTGQARVFRDKVHFWLSVPKSRPNAKPPFPVAYWEHGTTVHDTEMFIHAGNYARNGIALASADAPGHGLVLEKTLKNFLQGVLTNQCLVPFSDAIASGRAIDLNGDGIPDDGGLIWSAHIMHTRDGVRQGALEGVQLTRILRAFDGVTMSDQDFNGDGKPDLAGDFNGDGVVDVGGPSNRYFSSGGSLGGILAQVHGAIDPYITATAPVSGAGGFVDVNLRGRVTPVPVLEQALGPIILGQLGSQVSDTVTNCHDGNKRSVRWWVNDLFDTKEIEIACLDPSELSDAMTVVVQNVATGERRCARTGKDGAFRVPIPASVGDRISIQIINLPDQVDSYKGCLTLPNAPLGRRIDTWEVATRAQTPVANDATSCDSDAGCQQFRDRFYPVGSALVAPQEGIALMRGSPEFRRLMNLSQAALEPADPINYAPYYMLKSMRGIDGAPIPPRPLFDVHTAGDDQVLVSCGNAFARAAGALPFLPPSALATMPEYADYVTPQDLYTQLGGTTPDKLMIDNWVTEGLSRFARTPGSACGANWTPSTQPYMCGPKPAISTDTCNQTLFDADWLGESLQDYGQGHPMAPLRLARLAQLRATDGASIAKAWSPRLSAPMASADGAWAGGQALVATVVAFIKPLGQHDWAVGEPCESFDSVTYMDNLVAHWFQSNGQDLYYLTHPTTHHCLSDSSCEFLK